MIVYLGGITVYSKNRISHIDDFKKKVLNAPEKNGLKLNMEKAVSVKRPLTCWIHSRKRKGLSGEG